MKNMSRMYFICENFVTSCSNISIPSCCIIVTYQAFYFWSKEPIKIFQSSEISLIFSPSMLLFYRTLFTIIPPPLPIQVSHLCFKISYVSDCSNLVKVALLQLKPILGVIIRFHISAVCGSIQTFESEQKAIQEVGQMHKIDSSVKVPRNLCSRKSYQNRILICCPLGKVSLPDYSIVKLGCILHDFVFRQTRHIPTE